MKQHLLSLSLLAATSLMSVGAQAAGSVLGSSYSHITYAIYDDPTPVLSGREFGVVSIGRTVRVDAPNTETCDGSVCYGVYWFDGDSFDVLVRADPNASSAQAITLAQVNLDDLDFRSNGISVDVLGLSFNEAASDFTGYLESIDNPTGSPRPLVEGSVSGGKGNWSLHAKVERYSAQLVGDQAYMRFDVQTAAVPEPSTYALFGLGLAALGLASRRRAQG